MLIFVVEDNEWYNKLLVHNLSLNPEFEVRSFLTGKEMLSQLDSNPSIVTLDYRLPDIKGSEVLKKIKAHNPEIDVVVISEQDDIETAVDLLKKGAYDYIVKTNDIKERLHNVINHINEKTGLKKHVQRLEEEVEKKFAFEETIIGNSDELKKVYNLISKAIQTNIIVSITGETGTGKELVAKAIHYNSKRKKHPFIAVNMSAIPANLVESELFGHEKGSFTDASNQRIGKFEEAHNGTIFLDEIGEADLTLQAKILRVLQEKEITRVGSNKAIKINARVIVATNRNLFQEVKTKNFREDLYYRLMGIPIHLPPLRERENDILLLAKHFIDAFCIENKLSVKTLSDDAKKKLLSHSWPGNIRELKSIVDLAVVMSESKEICDNDLTINKGDVLSEILSENLSLREYNYNIVSYFMKKFNNKTKKVADQLNIGQTTVYRILKEKF